MSLKKDIKKMKKRIKKTAKKIENTAKGVVGAAVLPVILPIAMSNVDDD